MEGNLYGESIIKINENKTWKKKKKDRVVEAFVCVYVRARVGVREGLCVLVG